MPRKRDFVSERRNMKRHDGGEPAARRSYDNLQLIQRVLAVLEHFNNSQISTVRRVSAACDIPESSVVRILETLCVEGYLFHISRRGGYAVTSKITTLSSGFHGSSWLVERLKPLLDELTHKHMWPFSLAVLDRDVMVVRYSTIPLSPFAHVKTTLGKRMSLVDWAHGRAYISFCGSPERRHLARLVAASPEHRQAEILNDVWNWRRMIMRTRRRGYGLRCDEIDPTTGTIAAPIMLGHGRVAATLAMTFFRRAVNDRKIAIYATALKSAAAEAATIVQREIEVAGLAPSQTNGRAARAPGRNDAPRRFASAARRRRSSAEAVRDSV